MSSIEHGPPPIESLDALAEDLQRLRIAAGDISYAEIASRIARLREEDGVSPAAARVARSSVYDVFRAGRIRTSPALVAEIVRALGGEEADAEAWRTRCAVARTSPLERPAEELVLPHESPSVQKGLAIVLMIACFGLNIFGGGVVERFDLALYLDMIGTAIVAILLGPWHGALVGLATNGLGALTTVPETLPFALVNVVGALVWGYGVRYWRAARSPLRLLALSALVAVACTITAVPINLLVLGGVVDHASGGIIATYVALGEGIWQAAFSVNILLSLVDKLITGVVVLILVHPIAGALSLGSIERQRIGLVER
jgi:energy-coupling factor transport system substrate-specific component